MIKNYFKTAWRNLVKNRAHSFINILGLSVGLACSLLILLWVQSEADMDSFHKNGKLLYQVYERQYYDGKVKGIYNTPGVLGEELKKQIPEIKYSANLAFNDINTFKANDKIMKFEGSFAGPDYFKMFSFPLIIGNAQTAINSPSGIAISRKMAAAFFGNAEAAMGKTIRFQNLIDLKITGIFENVPGNSAEKFDFIANWDTFLAHNSWAKDWGNNGPLCYVMLRPDANVELVKRKLAHFLDNLNKNQKKGTFTIQLDLQRFDQTYLYSTFAEDGTINGGRIEYVHLFSIVALFILLIACINFMNLTTARSVQRSREIGVRKVIGAVRGSLIGQFIGESLMLTTIAVIAAVLFMVILLPLFNSITMKQLSLPFTQPLFWIKLMVITLITGLIAGSYPALFLSSFKPVNVLKGALKLDWKVTAFRKGLVVFQFVLSVVLILGTIIISRQINFVQTRNLGYDRENLIYLHLDGEMTRKWDLFKNEASKMPGIQTVSRASNGPTLIDNGTGGIQWEGQDPNISFQFAYLSVGYDFVKAMKLKMAQGRDYSKSFATDSVGYIINETALKRIGYKDPIGKPMTFWGTKGTIIGVLKDFHFNSMHEQIQPMAIRLNEHEGYGQAIIRTQPGQTKQALANLETLWKQINPEFPFNFSFADDEYMKLYKSEMVIGKLSTGFAFLAIFISCLGLLGLAMFTAEQRVKEIGIRKVLGASVASLFALLSGEFVVLVAVALIIASPLAWYAMDKWLQNYPYHAPIQWWMFALSAIIALAITLVTVSFQSVKAALSNPIKSLRTE